MAHKLIEGQLLKEVFKIFPIDETSPHLRTVKKLWRSSSDTLGFLPNGAFIEYASKKQIIIAADSRDKCYGYLMYRISRNRIIIVHLCVDPNQRNRGIATLLIEYLKRSTKDYLGIGLLCRRDFNVSQLWPKLNFVARTEKSGRGRTRENLTYWWYDHGHDSLLSIIDKQVIHSRIKTVIDANIFFDLAEKDVNIKYEESKALLAPWLNESIVLCITIEMFNEINRHGAGVHRQYHRKYADRFPIIDNSTACDLKDIENQLRNYFPPKLKQSDESDIRHLTHSILEGSQFFVTLDGDLLKLSKWIREKYGLHILRPSELIIHLDTLIREMEYNPMRLAGSLIYISLVRSVHVETITEKFLCSAKNERKKEFNRQLNVYLSDPATKETLLICDTAERPLALVIYNKEEENILEVPLFRVARGALSGTLARHLAFKAIRFAYTEGRKIIKVSDKYITGDVLDALNENSFVEVNQEWIKVNLPIVDEANKIVNHLMELYRISCPEYGHLKSLSNNIALAHDKKDYRTLCDIEKSIWPAKIIDLNIDSYIIPIEPRWAAHLFDEELACQMLFGSAPELSLRLENVYYRSKRPRVVSAPARILWYVSKDRNYTGSMQIRACSYLNECVENTPKVLFKKFQRLGVYGWKDVKKVAGGDINKEIMAILFSHTELFCNPIKWIDLQEILYKTNRRRSQIQSPIRISNECFTRLYCIGTENNKRGLKLDT